jgi:hypothetical protein
MLDIAVDNGFLDQHRHRRGHHRLLERHRAMRRHAACGLQHVEPGGAGLLLHLETALERAQPHAQVAGALDLVQELGAHHPLRNAVELGGDDDAVGGGLQIGCLCGVGNRAFPGQQEARPHRDPDRPIGERRCKAAAVRESAAGDHGNLHGIKHLGKQDGGRDRAGMAPAFAPLHADHIDAELRHLLRMLHRTDGWHAKDARILETADHPGVRPAPEGDGANLILVLDDQLDDSVGARLKAVEIDAERPIGAAPDGEQLLARLLGRHHRCAEKAKGARVGAGDHERRLRDPAHRGLDNRPAAAEPLRHHRAQRICHQASPACFLLAAAIDLASRPPRLLLDTRSFWAWAKWCM